MRFRPYINKALTYLNGRSTLDDLAVSVEELEDEENAWCPPAIFLKSELDKVIKVQGETKLETELARVHGYMATHRPLKRYEFQDVLVYPSGFSVKGGTFVRYGPLPHRELVTGKITDLDKAIFCADQPTMRYFGHWLMEACCTALLKRDDEALILPTPTEWPNTKDYVKIFDFDPAPGAVFRVDRLSWYVDFMQGRSHQQRYGELRRRVRAKFASTENSSKRIYLRRGAGGATRSYVNEQEIIDVLVKDGFDVLDIDREPLAEILKKGVGADVIVTIEGSNQCHATMMLREGGMLLAIQPPDRFNNVYRERTHAMGLDYGFVVAGKDAATGENVLDVDALLETLALFEEKQAAPSAQ